MALIQCLNCGHMISDKATKCPKCGCPVIKDMMQYQPYQQPAEEQAYYQKRSNSNKLLYVIIGILLVLIGIIGLFYFIKTNQMEKDFQQKLATESPARDSSAKVENTSQGSLADGKYCYKGEWVSKIHPPQPCTVEFEIKGNSLFGCAYTNLKYNVRIPLEGTIDGNDMHFEGFITSKKLIIDLTISTDGNWLIGNGVDYAHSGDMATLNLTKI